MRFKKIIIAGTIAGIIGNLWGLLTCQLLFKRLYYIEPVFVYQTAMLTARPLWLISMGAVKILIAVIITFAYSLIYKRIPGDNDIKKGVFFGFLVWLAGILPSRALLYMTLNLSGAIVVYWIINDLISYVILGAIIGFFYNE